MQIVQCGSIFISFPPPSPCLLKKASKARKDLQSVHEGNGAMLPPHPLPSLSPLSCRPQPEFSRMLPSALSCTPPTPCQPPPSFIFFLYLLYTRVCFYCLMRADTHLVLSGGGGVLFMQLWLFVFPPDVRQQCQTFLVFPSPPRVPPVCVQPDTARVDGFAFSRSSRISLLKIPSVFFSLKYWSEQECLKLSIHFGLSRNV